MHDSSSRCRIGSPKNCSVLVFPAGAPPLPRAPPDRPRMHDRATPPPPHTHQPSVFRGERTRAPRPNSANAGNVKDTMNRCCHMYTETWKAIYYQYCVVTTLPLYYLVLYSTKHEPIDNIYIYIYCQALPLFVFRKTPYKYGSKSSLSRVLY